MSEFYATTKWNDDPLKSPCVYLGVKCKNEKKGLIDEVMYNCRKECSTFKKYTKLTTDYKNAANEKKVYAQDYRYFKEASMQRSTRKKTSEI